MGSAMFLAFLAFTLFFVTPSYQIDSKFSNTAGFANPVFSNSAEGLAYCVSGCVKVPVTTTSNQKFKLNEPADQYAVTAVLLHYLQVNSSIASEIDLGLTTVSETFDINAKLCYPKGWNGSVTTVQILQHGIGFDKSYWDFAKNYSFTDAAANAGYPTFSYDRLGVGKSSRPDPIQIVQAAIQVEIAHTLINLLRNGTIAGQKFDHIVGVGHSFGSIQAVGVAARYPKDYDAIVLTGLSTSTASLGLTFADFNSAIAAENQPKRFGGLPNGYLVTDSAISNQFAFFYYPNFDTNIFLADDASKQTYTIGEVLTLGSVIAPSSFTGPLDVVLGQYDLIMTGGNSYYPTDQAALLQSVLFPNASKNSRSYIVPGAGHALNLHYETGFEQIQTFVKENGF